MKIWPYVLALLAVGALAVDGADARHARHHRAGQAPRAVDRAAPNPDAPAKDDINANRSAADDPDRKPTADRERLPKDAKHHRTGANGVDLDLIFVRPPARGAKHAVKPTKPKVVGTGSLRHAVERPQRPRPDAFGRTKTATAGAPAPSATTTGMVRWSPGAIGLAKANLNGVPGARQPPGAPATGSRSVPAANGLLHPPSGPTGPLLTGGMGLNGTGAGRPGARPGGIGGPAKVVAGISGTGMRTGR